jgi:prophage DNA circulation protein
MSWHDRLQPASFRGIPFFVKTTDADLGRRVEIIKYPGREDTTAQDLGRDSAEFSVQAFLIGDDYDIDLRALEDALLTAGPGRLVLPTRGELNVNIQGKFKSHEDTTERGGFVTVAFSCVVATPAPPTFASTQSGQALRSICDDLIDGNAERFASTVDTTGMPSSALASQLSLAASMSIAMGKATSTIASIVGNVASVQALASSLASQAETLLASPATLAESLGGAFESMFMDAADLVSGAPSILSKDFDATTIGLRDSIVTTVKKALTQIVDMTFRPDLDDSTPLSEQETKNNRAFSAMYRLQALAAFARAIPDFPLSSYQQAIALRDFFRDIVDDVEGDLDSEDYEALRDVDVVASKHLESVATSLPYLREYKPRAEMSALLIAYELYGDATRAGEIIGRNDIANPAAIPSSQVLEVSSV